jgi:hypothetical protein
MKPTLIAISIFLPLLSGAISTAQAVECAKGVVRAGCAGPNGAVVAGPRGAAAAGTMGRTRGRRFDLARPPRARTGTLRLKRWRPGVLS